MVFQAKKYNNRDELEADISAKLGRQINKNKETDCIIKGKQKELKLLHLSKSSSVFGCRVEIV